MSRSHQASRSGLYRAAPHVLPTAKRNCKVSASGWGIAAVLGVCVIIYVLYPYSNRPPQAVTAPEIASTDLIETRRQQRIKYGRVLRQYVKGTTKVHVAAVSSGNPTPYPGVNNTQRWQALAASCPYSFTILGRNEPWIGDKGVTKNKLMYYAKWLRTVAPEDVVIIVDAHDVLFFPCAHDIVEEYHAMGADIIFGADYNAFPDNYSAPYYPDSPKNVSHGPVQKFLNCGGIIGYAEDISYYIAKLFFETGRWHEAFKDQRFWTDMFLAQAMKTGALRGEEPTIGLDYYGAIFQMFRAAPVSDAGCWSMDLGTKSVTAAEKCPTLYDQEACILHGPGYSKKVFWFEMLPRWQAANNTSLY